mmetsp:Transcript_8069/g.8912  ORF Transcript_8069/g.8912 Transcript_8069/m.8912 type:complete len:214 (-) Transcript_8069:18-659(-)
MTNVATLSAATMASMELDTMPWKVQVSSASTAASEESAPDALSPSSSESDSFYFATEPKIRSALTAGMLSTSIAPPPGLEIDEGLNTPSKVEPTSSPEGLFHLVQELQQQVNGLQHELWTHQGMRTTQSMQSGMRPEDIWASTAALGTPFADGLPPAMPYLNGYMTFGQDIATRPAAMKGANAPQVRQFCTDCGARIQGCKALFCTSCGHRLN